MKYIFILCFISLFGCNSVEQILPLRNEINKISYFSIAENDNYNGLFSSKTDKPSKVIVDQEIIDNVYSLISKNYNNWNQLTIVPPKNLDYIIIFSSAKKQLLALWIKDDVAIILTKPIDPRNISVIYQPGIKVVKQLKSYLSIN